MRLLNVECLNIGILKEAKIVVVEDLICLEAGGIDLLDLEIYLKNSFDRYNKLDPT